MSQACHEAAEGQSGQSGQSFEDGSLRFSEAGGHRTKRELSDIKIYIYIYMYIYICNYIYVYVYIYTKNQKSLGQ